MAYPFWNFDRGSWLLFTLNIMTAIKRKNAAIAKQTRYTAKYPTRLLQLSGTWSQKLGIFSNRSAIPGASMTADKTVPRKRKTVQTILVAVEFLQEGHRAQQQKQVDEPQQQAACIQEKRHYLSIQNVRPSSILVSLRGAHRIRRSQYLSNMYIQANKNVTYKAHQSKMLVSS